VKRFSSYTSFSLVDWYSHGDRSSREIFK
jgi:hypothetical protein